jgi:hypothetical protein
MTLTTHPLAQVGHPEFQNRVSGTWGDFATPRGKVSYLMTSARLGIDSPDDESRLARALRPVREVLDVNSMSFSQLLQRDLDDYRVVTELVPYLLEGGINSTPAFFPPILAVLLPFQADREVPAFPAPGDVVTVDDGGLPLTEIAYGNAFAVRRLAETDGHRRINYGQLAWNDEGARVVVLDGQHRAMALLAIQRTVSKTWDNSGRGARYRNFYERRVAAMLDETGADLDEIRFPVTICWYPEAVAESNRSARQLFVDVNKEARPPSGDRVVLLNDSNLLDIFTREFLDHLRAGESHPPLYAIEYDQSRTAGIHSKWSSISSLRSIQHIIDYLVFGPRKYLEEVDISIRGSRGAQYSEDEIVRERLRVSTILPFEIATPDGVFDRNDLGKFSFPAEVKQRLVDEFLLGWGGAVRRLLAEVSPYAQHYDALQKVRDEWEASDQGGPDSLAREAVFGGGNLYWTLRKSALKWRDDPDAQEVRRAWQHVGSHGEMFRKIRAIGLLGEDSDQSLSTSESLYEVLGTNACQLGLALTFATVASRAGVSGESLPRLASVVANALNAGMEVRSASGLQRVLVFSKGAPKPLNRITDMNTPRGVEFRYFWLEMLCLPESIEVLDRDGSIAGSTIRALRDAARGHYFAYIIQSAVKRELQFVNTASEQTRVEILTSARIFNLLRSSVMEWFGVTVEEFEEWASAFSADIPALDAESLDDELDEDLEDE